MKNVLKGVGGIVVLGVLFIVVFWLMQHGAVDNTKNIEFIEAHCYNGKVVDMQNEVSVRGVEDVKWYYDKHDTIVIEYGKILLKYKVSEFIKPEIQQALNRVFITTKQNPETLELTLYWNDQEMTEYVKK